MTSCNATFIVNDYLFSRFLDVEENELRRGFAFNNKVEEALRQILEDNESIMFVKITSIDSKERDSHSHYVSVMINTEDGSALENKLRALSERRKKGFELLLFTDCEHTENDARRQALNSFIDEELSSLAMDDKEQEKASDPVVRIRLSSWLMDEIRSVLDYGIREALEEAQKDL